MQNIADFRTSDSVMSSSGEHIDLGELSVVVPTFREVKNIPLLVERLDKIRTYFSSFEVIIVDDDSNDGTEALVHKLQIPWLRLKVRKENRGLSPSVIEGITLSEFNQICVMDADLSHPPETIPDIIRKLQSGQTEMVVGSRYCEGGRIDLEWSWFRHFNSRFATLLARPFTSIKDPMSGFFAFRKELFANAQNLNPIGYKIALELMVKGNAKQIEEVPIIFADRILGESKLSMKEQLNYLRHIKRLFDYKFGNFSYFIQFGFSGAMGAISNIAFLEILKTFIPLRIAMGIAIYFSMFVTFSGNRYITFNHGKLPPWFRQYISFVAAAALGAVINWTVSIYVIEKLLWPSVVGSMCGIFAGMFFNFIFSRYLIFKGGIVVR